MLLKNRCWRYYVAGLFRLWQCLFFFFVPVHPFYAQEHNGINWEELRAAEKGKSPYVSRVIEYRPAPGQFVNIQGIGTPEAAESITGTARGLVTLGGFGGYIIAGFDHTILNDPDNPYGVDFTVVGNAAQNSSEPGIVMVMKDTNGNGQPDDTWYELKGSNHGAASTLSAYTVTYENPQSTAAKDIPWSDNRGGEGFVRAVSFHDQPYYPLPDIFPDYPQDKSSFTGTLIELEIDAEDSQYIRIPSLPFGYADNLPFTGGAPFLPDNPETVGVLEGNGGNAFDIGWAVDENGNPVYLEGIDFIKIYTAVNLDAGWLGEISAEICGIIDVSPDDVMQVSLPVREADIAVFPNPTSDYINIKTGNDTQIDRIEILNVTGKPLYVNEDVHAGLLSIPVQSCTPGIYFLRIFSKQKQETRKIIIR